MLAKSAVGRARLRYGRSRFKTRRTFRRFSTQKAEKAKYLAGLKIRDVDRIC